MTRVYYQNEFKKDERKIILSQEVFTRLLGFINLCGYMTGIDESKLDKGYEYGGWLVGKINSDGNIEFTITNSSNKFIEKDGRFSYSEDKDAFDEVLTKLYREDFNCVAQFHTHPYNKKEASRLFSDKDISVYKGALSSGNFSKTLRKNILSFGCLLTCSDDKNPEMEEKDDIAFVSYDIANDQMLYFPNIYVKTLDNKLIKLPHIKTEIYVDEEGIPYRKSQIDSTHKYEQIEIERTNLYLEDDSNKLNK